MPAFGHAVPELRRFGKIVGHRALPVNVVGAPGLRPRDANCVAMHERESPRPGAGGRRHLSRKGRWPEGQKIALSVRLAFEAFANHSQLRTLSGGAVKVNHFSLSLSACQG
jgi:hypothetical protein